jgi:hypothetical protein
MEGPPEMLAKAIKRLGSVLTPILIEYGYIKTNTEVTSVEGRRPGKSLRDAPPELEWSEKMTAAIDAYKEQMGRASFLDAKMKEAQKLQMKYEAAALWDKV